MIKIRAENISTALEGLKHVRICLGEYDTARFLCRRIGPGAAGSG